MRKSIVLLSLAMGLAGCNQEAGNGTAGPATDAAANATAPRPAYCFFKQDETKDWSASRDAAGNIIVKGRAFRSDPRYRAELGPAEVSGDRATLSPTIVQNTGYASPDNWWDVSATIPDSTEVEAVTVRCGKKVLAEFKVPRRA